MDSKNLIEVFDNSVKKRRDAVCFRYKSKEGWKSLSWNEVYQKVIDVVGGLKKLGVKPGDRVAIFSKVRYEWTVCDLAILACGAITIPVYESNIPEVAAYIIENAGVKVIFVDDSVQLEKIKKVQGQLKNLSQIIVFDKPKNLKKGEGIYTIDELMVLAAGEGEETFKASRDELTPDSLATYVYTSGTTGPPKGAILTHGNFLSELEAVDPVFNLTPQIESLLFLPLAHIFARMIQFVQLQKGCIQTYAESIDKLLDNISEVKPHFLGSVPRIFEKVHMRVMQGVEASSESKKKIFNWALKVGKQRSDYLVARKSVPAILKIQWMIAYRLVFSKIHAKMGGRMKFFVSGGAPLAADIAQFFHSAGLIILEGYGLTETTAAITCNSLSGYKIGCVGPVLKGIEIKIAEDGEILVRGGVVFKGYYRLPEDTARAINKDGWFHTGDIGVFDKDGFLKITDRKKDIIVTAGGKNVAPQNIESLIKADPIISQVMVHGDNRKFLSALITLDHAEITNYAKKSGITFKDYSDLVTNEKVYQFVKARIDEKNRQLAKYETIKKFAILATDFSVETGELTPTLKVKRKFTSEKYKDILDQFYQD